MGIQHLGRPVREVGEAGGGVLLQDDEEAVGLLVVTGICHVVIFTFHLILSSSIFKLAFVPPMRVWLGGCFWKICSGMRDAETRR